MALPLPGRRRPGWVEAPPSLRLRCPSVDHLVGTLEQQVEARSIYHGPSAEERRITDLMQGVLAEGLGRTDLGREERCMLFVFAGATGNLHAMRMLAEGGNRLRTLALVTAHGRAAFCLPVLLGREAPGNSNLEKCYHDIIVWFFRRTSELYRAMPAGLRLDTQADLLNHSGKRPLFLAQMKGPTVTGRLLLTEAEKIEAARGALQKAL